jgi:hypothetical protein
VSGALQKFSVLKQSDLSLTSALNARDSFDQDITVANDATPDERGECSDCFFFHF